MNKNDWNPELYLKYEKERTQPVKDLVARINSKKPDKILDIGCGPGNSTQILAERWPDSHITGIDNSPAMIEKAKSDFPNLNWKILDAGNDEIMDKYDLVFSNAAIHWIPNHAELLQKFNNILNKNGVIAVQLPLSWDTPLGKSITNITHKSRWSELTLGVTDLFTNHNYSYYYNQLTQIYHSIEIWESYYMHVMDSHLSILEMIRSTRLKPFLERLETESDKKDFENEVLKGIEKDYPLQNDGKVIFPFKRLFFMAVK